jgi:hypothetical protein
MGVAGGQRSSLAHQLDHDLGSAAAPKQLREFARMLTQLRAAISRLDQVGMAAQAQG